ncbi:MAG: helix-turn-helix domain-containing protein [Ruminococcus sp.]|nr:helix-turn-helix domain-containing protein [Ruminococcus sp.]
MILADKIIELRKKAGLSQDELAEQMDVSRQSVSKWEGAQSVPDLNKILKLSEIFGVSIDYLLKDDFEKPAPEISEIITDSKPLRRVSMEDANKFLAVNERSAFKIASGVALCILSVVPSTLTGAIFPKDDFLNCIGASTVFIMVAGGIFLIVRANSTKKGFSKLLEEDGFTREKKSKEKENGVIVGSYWLIVTAGYLAYSFITSNWGKSWIVFPVAALLTPIVHNIEKKIKSK